MNSAQYAKISEPFRENAGSARILRGVDRLLTTSFYVLHPLLLLLLLLSGNDASETNAYPFPMNPLLIPCIIIPALGIVAVSLLRKAMNAPRPYETLDIIPIIRKNTQGQSFPSKHVFSSFCIAMCWFAWKPVVGAALLALACCIAIARVIGGVHWPRDVAAGALLGIACGMLVFLW